MADGIAIIGAGMAGLAAARALKAAGLEPTLFDKSRGLGGRMATRRVDDPALGALTFDHGAQYFTAKGPAFRAVVDDWCAAGRATAWFNGGYVGTPGMTAPARALAEGLTVVGGCPVTGLRRAADGWTVATASGAVDTPGNGGFAAVVLAVPAPQAVPLAASAGVAMPALAAVRYGPCWALMLAFDAPLGLDWNHLRREDGPIGWVARNASKPGRAGGAETLVVHAGPDWSRQHLELTPEAAEAALDPLWRAATGITAAPRFVSVHRWRYALVEETAGEACLWDADTKLGACGDWCLGPRVEAAFDSGAAMAARVIESLGVSRAA